MKPLSKTYKELGIAFTFPIKIKDAKGEVTYFENSGDYWCKYEYDAEGNETYYESSSGCWLKCEYDSNGKQTYSEDSEGYSLKCEYDANGKQTYFEDSNGVKKGTPHSVKTCEGKVIEVDGIKYKLTAQ